MVEVALSLFRLAVDVPRDDDLPADERMGGDFRRTDSFAVLCTGNHQRPVSPRALECNTGVAPSSGWSPAT